MASKMKREARCTLNFCKFMEQANHSEIEQLARMLKRWNALTASFEEIVMQEGRETLEQWGLKLTRVEKAAS